MSFVVGFVDRYLELKDEKKKEKMFKEQLRQTREIEFAKLAASLGTRRRSEKENTGALNLLRQRLTDPDGNLSPQNAELLRSIGAAGATNALKHLGDLDEKNNNQKIPFDRIGDVLDVGLDEWGNPYVEPFDISDLDLGTHEGTVEAWERYGRAKSGGRDVFVAANPEGVPFLQEEREAERQEALKEAESDFYKDVFRHVQAENLAEVEGAEAEDRKATLPYQWAAEEEEGSLLYLAGVKKLLEEDEAFAKKIWEEGDYAARLRDSDDPVVQILKDKFGEDLPNAEVFEDPSFSRMLGDIARYYGIPIQDIITLMDKESSFDPTAENPDSGAYGLFQFMPQYVDRLGITPQELVEANPQQQLELFHRYLELHNYQQGDKLGIIWAAPAFKDRSDDTVVYEKGSPAWRDNPAWRPPGGGSITVGSINRYYGV